MLAAGFVVDTGLGAGDLIRPWHRFVELPSARERGWLASLWPACWRVCIKYEACWSRGCGRQVLVGGVNSDEDVVNGAHHFGRDRKTVFRAGTYVTRDTDANLIVWWRNVD